MLTVTPSLCHCRLYLHHQTWNGVILGTNMLTLISHRASSLCEHFSSPCLCAKPDMLAEASICVNRQPGKTCQEDSNYKTLQHRLYNKTIVLDCQADMWRHLRPFVKKGLFYRGRTARYFARRQNLNAIRVRICKLQVSLQPRQVQVTMEGHSITLLTPSP